MINTELQVRDRVLAGIAFLDEHAPDWRERVDPETLDIREPRRCILGQVFREQAEETHDSGFGWALGQFGSAYSDGPTGYWQSDLGFAFGGLGSSVNSSHWTSVYENKVLTRAWRLVLAA